MQQLLAEILRPTRLDQLIGQEHLLGSGKPLRILLETGKIHSSILWGPSGTGKTSLARIAGYYSQSHWLSISAVNSGMKEIREIINIAIENKKNNESTLVFVDEVHRFNKVQQDAFLPYIEDATMIFIGATTENPSFELNNALLSRCRVYILERIDITDLVKLIDKGVEKLQVNYPGFKLTEKIKRLIADIADGDARRALTIIQISAETFDGHSEINANQITQIAGKKLAHYDKGADQFYQQISAFQKSIRGSDPDAGLYWLARMLLAGCDPFYIARRLTVIASEDIGNADPRAITIALNAWDVLSRLGQPEGELALAQATTYLACAAKSNASYKGYKMAKEIAKSTPNAAVPIHLRNASTQLERELNYAGEYRYDHDQPEGYSAGQRYFPNEVGMQTYYHPVNRGLEIKIKQRLDYLKSLTKHGSKANNNA